MPYIAPSTKQARLWVEAVSKSLKIEKGDAAAMYARLCDFNSWDQLVQAIGRGQPSQTDEQVTKDVMQTRRAFYSEVLVDEFGMSRRFANYIIEKVSPSSSKKPSRFSLDISGAYDEDPDTPTLGDLFSDFGMDSDEEMDKAMEAFMRETMGDSLPDDFSFENIAERMRISKPIDPGAWYDLLYTIGWDLIDESFRSEYAYGEESFIAIKDGEEIPVYITSLVRTPYDVEDEMANSLMSRLERYTEEEFDTDKAIVFWGQPLVKDIDGNSYAHFGMYWANGQWHEFLMNQHTTINELFNQHNDMDSIDSPPKSLCDEGMALSVGAIKIINHIDQEKKISIRMMRSPSGWNHLLPSED